MAAEQPGAGLTVEKQPAQFADVLGRRTATAANQLGACGFPGRCLAGKIAGSAAGQPLAGSAVPAGTAVGVTDERFARRCPRPFQEPCHVLGRRTVHTGGDDGFAAAGQLHTTGNWLTAADVLVIAAAESDPGGRLPILRQQFDQRLSLRQAGYRLAGQKVRFGVQQGLETRPVHLNQGFF